MAFLRSLHATFLAYWIKWLRVRYLVKQFKLAHAQEVIHTPVQMLPITLARHDAELRAVRAGQLTARQGDDIVDRKSWKYPFLPSSIRRLQVPILKVTPYNMRRMSRTPVPRRAMNMIKGAAISLTWDVEPIEGIPVDDPEEQAERIRIAKTCFQHPNNDDSFQSFIEQGLEDYLIMGGFCAELALTVDPQRPFKSWIVNVDSIRLMPGWTESTPDMPRYVQMTGLKGERGALAFYDDEMLYLKDNPSTDNPFGLGCMEVAFASVNAFLGVQDMSGRAGTDQIHKTWLWWEHPQPESTMQIVRRHIQNDLEGQAKISLLGGAKKPDVLEVTPVKIEDLLIPWQELLIRMIANSFNMSAMALGIEHDINRAVGETLSDKDFRTAVVPTAKRLEEGFTRRVLHNKLKWYDLRFKFTNLDDPDEETMLGRIAKLYSMNAMTPARALKLMNMKPLDSPFAELTQVEAMILMTQAAGMSQDQLADHAVTRQQKQQESMPPPMGGPGGGPGGPPQGPSGGNGGKSGGGGASGQYGQPKSPKALSLPKFPIQGTRYTAKQVAQMPTNQMQDVFWTSGLKTSAFLKAMDEQEPGILETLTNDTKDFLQDRLDEEKKSSKVKPIPPKTLKKWEQELTRSVRQNNKRTNDLATWLREGGANQGRPGNSSGSYNSGRPGKGPVMRS